MLKFKDFINERYERTVGDYAVGDIVLIRYYLTGDIVPVKIVEKKSHYYFIVSHKVEGSPLYNAPSHGIKADEIISRYQGVSDISDDRSDQNPRIKPDVSGLVPGWDSYSNDISI